MKNILLICLFLFFTGSYGQNYDSFLPESGRYIVSYWVKEDNNNVPITYNNSNLKVSLISDNSPAFNSQVLFKPSGNIIDGWQRAVGIVNVPTLTDDIVNPRINIELICTNPSGDCYFDDIRFYPYNGNMKSFVYDEETQRLMAELDENNYATFYEYDLEGGLVRIKKETERGVFTIQETRSSNPKKEK
jgi:hypothetical protein